ncbi:MAG: aminotransferase class V-fold PLP-dependent enzyme [Anaerolineae bacterium]|nr:aminotransferase class V-fold PLP-dependent enzyme [Anaerolineae bacterium]
MTTQPDYDLETLRREFPISQQFTYLDHASIAPIPLPSQQVMQAVAQRLAADPGSLFGAAPDDVLGNLFVTFPAAVAGLINAADPREIVGVASTSTALNLVAQSIDWQPGDNIVFSAVEFPSNVYPWMVLERRGVECRQVPGIGLTPDALADFADESTRLVAVSALQFWSGHRADLAALGAFCRERGILFVVDAIQAAGHMPVDVQAMQIDILACGGQKSLMSLPGQGFLYVRDAVCQTLQPGLVGPNAVKEWLHWLKYDLTPEDGAQRFMMGTTNITGMAVLVESLRFLRALGLENIDAWTRHLSQVVIHDLSDRGYTIVTPTDPAHHGSIVTFRVGDPDDREKANTEADTLVERLRAEQVRLRKHVDAAGAPYLRISTHCYNTEDDVHRVGMILGEYEYE